MKNNIVKKVKREILKSIQCDICKKEYKTEDPKDELEIEEFQEINFIGGYESVFGDGTKVSIDICQHCLKEKLGEFLILKQ